jgi:hypothetical protein
MRLLLDNADIAALASYAPQPIPPITCGDNCLVVKVSTRLGVVTVQLGLRIITGKILVIVVSATLHGLDPFHAVSKAASKKLHDAIAAAYSAASDWDGATLVPIGYGLTARSVAVTPGLLTIELGM